MTETNFTNLCRVYTRANYLIIPNVIYWHFKRERKTLIIRYESPTRVFHHVIQNNIIGIKPAITSTQSARAVLNSFWIVYLWKQIYEKDTHGSTNNGNGRATILFRWLRKLRWQIKRKRKRNYGYSQEYLIIFVLSQLYTQDM